MLSAGVGGTNFRTGIIELSLNRAPDLSKAKVAELDVWRHRDEKPTREEAVERLVNMLQKLLRRAEKRDLKLTPLIGIGCPGVIEPDGSIDRGGAQPPRKLGKQSVQSSSAAQRGNSENWRAPDPCAEARAGVSGNVCS